MISPCRGICKINSQTMTCFGCYRTLEQIKYWTKYTEEERRKITEQCVNYMLNEEICKK